MASGAETKTVTNSQHHHSHNSKWPDFTYKSESPELNLRHLMGLFASASFRTNGTEASAQDIQERCISLFKLDHAESFIVDNSDGELSSGYPFSIIIPRDSVDQVPALDSECVRKLFVRARNARCRARFPAPAILLDGAYICRSATLSGGIELNSRSIWDAFLKRDGQHSPTPEHQNFLGLDADASQLHTNVRARDIKLLESFGVTTICDLMVEKKKVKFGVYISSSEKVDKENRYGQFTILSTPYPGCEFFKEFRDNGYTADGLFFDWTQSYIDQILDLPVELQNLGALKDISWHEYRTWDLISMTKNYLKLYLYQFLSSKSSLLIHCISGWDRTPLFTSLLRLSLWADGKIHQSLNAMEITFLTVAYDWYLFGHKLFDRLQKDEEILFFTFYFLQFIECIEFNVDFIREDINRSTLSSQKLNSNGSSNSSLEVLEVVTSNDVPSNHYNNHLGSCTSLNSTCSFTSLKSHDSNPPSIFHCQTESMSQANVFQTSYPGTPPTLTNSEEGACIFDTNDPPPLPTHPHATSYSSLSSSTTQVASELETSVDTVDGNIRRSPVRSSLQQQQSVNLSSRTTPVPIPLNATNTKQRRSSGKFDESWQFVSDTGSIKDSPRAIHYSSPSSHESTGSSNKRNSVSSENTLRMRKTASTRRENLQAVRSYFNNAYSAAIGFRLKNGENNLRIQTSGLSLLCQHLVGNYPRVHAPQ